jgi:hypothetical protein
MLRIPHCLDDRLADGGKVSTLLTRRTLLPRNIIIFMFLVLISVRGWIDRIHLNMFILQTHWVH